MLDRADLVLVLAVKECGTLTGAARRLEISTAAVTKRLANIESQLSVRLFSRSTRSVVVTPEGELYCELAARLIHEFEDLESRLTDLSGTPQGNIRIACNVGFGRMWLAPLIAQFTQSYPQVSIELDLVNRLPDLQAEGYDCAIWLWSSAPTHLIVTTLARNHRVLVASRAYLDRAGSPVDPSDLRQHACLLLDDRDTPAALWRLSRVSGQADATHDAQIHEGDVPVDVRVSGVLRSNNGEVLRDWALHGYGIALRPYWDVHTYLSNGMLVRVLPDYARVDADIRWIAPYLPHTPQRIKLLKRFLETHLREAPWFLQSQHASTREI
ncbi:LysR family transcriptional activator of dmlA [Paraburkholderia sp. GAS199]|uniref:LysR family transcriptional regulator n=1 Tax=Paraburkholderia sp. GAS199 TaxID=3035126 RepID=UPI003D1FF7E3